MHQQIARLQRLQLFVILRNEDLFSSFEEYTHQFCRKKFYLHEILITKTLNCLLVPQSSEKTSTQKKVVIT